MHVIEVLSGLLGLLLGVALGMWLAKRKQPDYEALQATHASYRKDVEQHFEKSAQLAQQMAEDYRNMYQHLAQGAVSLCENDTTSQAASLAALQRDGEPSKPAGVASPSMPLPPEEMEKPEQ